MPTFCWCPFEELELHRQAMIYFARTLPPWGTDVSEEGRAYSFELDVSDRMLPCAADDVYNGQEDYSMPG